jgi:predicted O-methyltransferase YrrM
MEPVEGWLTGPEADLLARAAAVAARGDGQLVEIGSYCGRSTVVQALAVQAAAPDRSASRMIAIDPHEGYEHGGGLDSYVLLKETLRRHQVEPVVDVVCRRSVDVTLPDTIGMVFIDGMHDVRSVCADRDHVRERISVHGLMAMHDYRPEFPGVVEAAEGLLREGEFSVVGFTDSLLVLRREQ